jgi:hypothetical protein
LASSNTWLPNGSFTTTQTSADIATKGFKGIVMVVDITAGSSLSLTPALNGKDVASGKYYTLLGSVVALTGVGTTKYFAGQYAPAAGLLTLAALVGWLPEFVQLVMTAGNATAATYSIGYDLI